MASFAKAYHSRLQISCADEGAQLAFFAVEGHQVCLAKQGREVVAHDCHGKALAQGQDVALLLVQLMAGSWSAPAA